MTSSNHRQHRQLMGSILLPHPERELLFQHPDDKLPILSQNNDPSSSIEKESQLHSKKLHEIYARLQSREQIWEEKDDDEDESVYGPDIDTDGLVEYKEFIYRINNWLDKVDNISERLSRLERNQDWIPCERRGVVINQSGDLRNEVEFDDRKMGEAAKKSQFVAHEGGDACDTSSQNSEESDEDSGLSFLERLRKFESCQAQKISKVDLEEEEYFDAVEVMVEEVNNLSNSESDGKTCVHEETEEKWIEDYKNLKEEDFDISVSNAEDDEEDEEDYGEDSFVESGEIVGVVAIATFVFFSL